MILDAHKAQDLSQLKKENRNFRLACTSGCFDLFHPGHAYFLGEIRKGRKKNYDKLLVVTHSDRAIKESKNHERPIMTENERALILDSIKGVDFVIVWDGWDNITNLIYDIKPDALYTDQVGLDQANWKDNWQAVTKNLKAELFGVKRQAMQISTTDIIKRIQ